MLTKLRTFVKEHMDRFIIVSTALGTAFMGLAIANITSEKSSSFLFWVFIAMGLIFFSIALYLAGILAIQDKRRWKEEDKERKDRIQREEALFNEQMDAFRKLKASEVGKGINAEDRNKEIEDIKRQREGR